MDWKSRNPVCDGRTTEILFLKDKAYQLRMQVSIPRKQLNKRRKNPRYTVHERLLILRHMEASQMPRRKVSRYYCIGRAEICRSTRRPSLFINVPRRNPPNLHPNARRAVQPFFDFAYLLIPSRT